MHPIVRCVILKTSAARLYAPFPYTTLFRSRPCRSYVASGVAAASAATTSLFLLDVELLLADLTGDGLLLGDLRSEEHTSELQSRENLVCRLLLEKKKVY